MAGFAFPGGIESVAISDDDSFDGTTGDFNITVPRNQIAAEGFDIAEPSEVEAALADDRMVGMGYDQEINLRFTDLDTADFDSLQQARNDATEVYVKVTSTATDGSSNALWEIVYQNVILSGVKHSAVNVDRSAYGVVAVKGMTTGYSTDDIYSITQGGGSV